MTNNRTIQVTEVTRRNFLKGSASLIGGGVVLAAPGAWLGSPADGAEARVSTHQPADTADSLPSAEELVAAIQAELQEIDTQIQNHPYLSALQKKRVRVDALKAFPGHEYHTVRSDLRSMAQLVQRFGHHPLAGPFFNGVLQGEIAGLPAIVQMAEKLDMNLEELESYEVTPAGFTYPTYMAWESVYGSGFSADARCRSGEIPWL